MSVDGLDELNRKLEALENEPKTKLGAALMGGAFVLEGKIKISMGEQKSGRRYGKHIASAPGEAPAIDMGALVNSVASELLKEGDGKAEAQVFTNMEYAPHLEFGTAHIEARPFMRPAADKNETEISAAVARILNRLIKKAAEG